jgi:tRNA-specific 2-thiouridylase
VLQIILLIKIILIDNKKINMSNKTVVVGMSGGVDSSVSAYLLKKQGFNVIGLFMKNWQSEPGEVCTSEIDFKDASEVCDMLDIPLHKANFSDDYWDRVFKQFLSEHEKGRTPNPDILCNREIKFKSFYDYALKIGADFIATGHYAKVKNDDGEAKLYRSKDIDKDQTYFLHEVSSKEFSKSIFPLSDIYKSEVRDIAKELNLNIHSKKDSVGICFVGEKNLRDFLNRFIKFKKGNILNTDNEIIGEHNGSILYTIGQRQGLGIGGIKDKDELPWYVYGKNISKNEIYVCQGVDNQLLYTENITLDNIHWINKLKKFKNLDCLVQIRHRHKPVKCNLEFNEGFRVTFDEEIRGVAPGQSAVFYKDNLCLGGGVIEARNNDL